MRRIDDHALRPAPTFSPVTEFLLPIETVPSLIDHTLLKPEATEGDVRRLCEEAAHFGFAAVCVNPYWVSTAAERLGGPQVRVCTVIGFPLGANRTAIKLAEAREALADGARELDMVINVGALRSVQYAAVSEEIEALAGLAHEGGAMLKVILETCLLTQEEKVAAAKAAAGARADFVKTSTGFSTGGATIEDVRLLRETVGNGLGVKASGGVRTWAALQEMVRAGATRIGTSSGVSILREMEASQSKQPSNNINHDKNDGTSENTY